MEPEDYGRRIHACSQPNKIDRLAVRYVQNTNARVGQEARRAVSAYLECCGVDARKLTNSEWLRMATEGVHAVVDDHVKPGPPLEPKAAGWVKKLRKKVTK